MRGAKTRTGYETKTVYATRHDAVLAASYERNDASRSKSDKHQSMTARTGPHR